jgi:hypothetical protein
MEPSGTKMGEKDKVHPLLQRALYLYKLPEELLDTLVLKGDTQIEPHEAPQADEEDCVVSDSTGCITCNIITFADVSQQREHMRSDLHRFNLKRKLAGQKTVSADEFDQMLDGRMSMLWDGFVNTRLERVHFWV